MIDKTDWHHYEKWLLTLYSRIIENYDGNMMWNVIFVNDIWIRKKYQIKPWRQNAHMLRNDHASNFFCLKIKIFFCPFETFLKTHSFLSRAKQHRYLSCYENNCSWVKSQIHIAPTWTQIKSKHSYQNAFSMSVVVLRRWKTRLSGFKHNRLAKVYRLNFQSQLTATPLSKNRSMDALCAHLKQWVKKISIEFSSLTKTLERHLVTLSKGCYAFMHSKKFMRIVFERIVEERIMNPFNCFSMQWRLKRLVVFEVNACRFYPLYRQDTCHEVI